MTYCDTSSGLVIQSDGMWSHIDSRFDRSDSSTEHLLRLMKSVSDLSYGLGVVTTFYTGAYFPLIISSHFQFGRSEPRYLLSFGVQSHHIFSVSAFRVTISSQFRRSEPPSLLSFDVQSHHLFSVWRLEQPSILSYGIQSRHLFIAWRLEPPYLLSYDVQSRLSQFGVKSQHFFSVSTFRAAISSQFGRSEPPTLFSLAFRVTIHF